AVHDRPSLICCRTHIGMGSPNKVGTHEVHGAALGNDEIAAMRDGLRWPHKPLEIPKEIGRAWNALESGRQRESEWQRRFDIYAREHAGNAADFMRRTRGDLPAGWSLAARKLLDVVQSAAPNIATRKASQNALDAIAPLLPELLGGSADLTASNLTHFKGCIEVRRGSDGHGPDFGNHINYGVREFGMSAAMNGIALHGGYIPYGGTFLTFSDYSRNAIRMAALMRQRVIFVLTHDSIGLGEDGPTHQPIEHVASLRLIPDVHVFRPCDATETMASWIAAIERRDGPSCLILSRQNLPAQLRTADQLAAIDQGGYVLAECVGTVADAVIVATGSGVALAIAARQTLASEGIDVGTVSMPCIEQFQAQPPAYRHAVLPPNVPCVAVEAGHPSPWYRWVGARGHVIGIERFGESAPAGELFELFGFTTDKGAAAVRKLLSKEAR
ncbi:MAG: transketolase C-terminal domain-containing protein, partial [Dokdonella sp.]